MKERTNYVKRTKRDYTLTFKLNVVKELESGELTISKAKKRGMVSRERARFGIG